MLIICAVIKELKDQRYHLYIVYIFCLRQRVNGNGISFDLYIKPVIVSGEEIFFYLSEKF